MSFTSPTDRKKMVKGNEFFLHSKCDATRVTDDINSKICKDSHRNLVLTPSTESSTPESENRTNYDVNGSAKIMYNPNSSKEDLLESLSYAERGLQRHLSQTDNHIQLLDRNGDLNEVAGSQSMLSQELIDHDQDHNDNDGNEANSRSDVDSCLFGDLSLPEGSQSKSSIGIAKRLGLLTQTQEEVEEEEDETIDTGERENTVGDCKSVQRDHPTILTTVDRCIAQEKKNYQPVVESHQHDISKKKPQNNIEGHYMPSKGEKIVPSPNRNSFSHKPSEKFVGKVPFSGLELLTQVGINEADKLRSFSTKSNMNSNGDKKDIFTTSNLVSSRDNEGFGSLLDAVAKITEQEASGTLSMNWRPLSATVVSTGTKSRKHSKKREVAQSLPTKKRGLASKQRKSEMQKLKEKLRREKIEQENERAQAIAKKAAMIAERTISDPAIAKKLLLSMALARENPRSVPQALPGKGHVVQEGFFWAHYPPLEFVLKKHMAEYYELSTHQCQSRQQQAFNNYMVDIVKDVAEVQQWEFVDSFCDKSLRDRIRCYYKTHIQNAKKRLRTMVRNPTKRANARHLCEHVDLIEQHRVEATHIKLESIHSDQKKSEYQRDFPFVTDQQDIKTLFLFRRSSNNTDSKPRITSSYLVGNKMSERSPDTKKKRQAVEHGDQPAKRKEL